MVILHAEIQVGGRSSAFAESSFSFWQLTDYEGRPNTDVRLGLIEVTLVGEEATWLFWEEWMVDSYRRQSGLLVFFQSEEQVAKTVVFYDAFCVHYQCRFDARGRDGKGSFETEIHLSAAAKEVYGQYSQAHSTIPWATDKATSYRALTPPQKYLPSAALGVATKALAAAVASKVTPSLPPAAKSVVPYLTTEMQNHYVGEETGVVWGTEVKYLSADERKEYLLTVGKDGLIRNAQNELFDTTASKTATETGKSIFAMDEKGNMYASPHQSRGLFHHSSFLAGAPVAAAGELIAKQGVITHASNGSGHYKPEPEFTHQFVEQLRRDGVKDTDKIAITGHDY